MLAAYILAQAMSVALFGRLGDRWGIRSVLLAGAALIASGSLVAALGDSLAVLVAGRLLQGAGAGSLQVVAFATAGARYSGAERAKVLGVVTAFIGVVSGSGTLIGGALTDALSWRAVVALPALSLVAMAAAVRLAPTVRSASTRIDALGAGLVAALSLAIVLLLESSSIDLAGWLIALAAATAVLAVVLLWRRVRAVPDGFIPLALARSRGYTLASLIALTLGAGYLAMLFAAPLLLAGRGWSATQVGLILVPAGGMGAISARIVGSLIATHDSFRVITVLAAINAAGLLLGAVAGADGAVFTVLALGMAVSGFAAGQVALVNRVSVLAREDVRAVATGLLVLMFLLGGAIGSALVAGLIGSLGLAGAVGSAAVLPCVGALLAWLASGPSREGNPVVGSGPL